MNKIDIRTLTPADLPQIVGLQQVYASRYPGAPVIPGEYYLSPAFHEGQDVFCAFDHAPDGERLVAYAPVYAQIVQDGPAELPHRLWTEVKAHPDLLDPDPLKEQLLEQVTRRSRELVQPFPGRAARLIFDYRTTELPAIRFVLTHGFAYTESVFYLRRDLNAPLPEVSKPEGIHIRRWRMGSELEQTAYVAARNECFPEAPIQMDEWRYYMQSPQWAVGVMIGAFSGVDLVGAVNVYWDDEKNRQIGRMIGSTEDIFVRAPWRGKGIARAAIVEGMRYLIEHGLEEAHLCVLAQNQNALGLYKGLGYQVMQESRFYAKALE